MLHKFRRFSTERNARKKTIYFVYGRKPRFFSRRRKSSIFPSYQPRLITTSTGSLTPEQIDILKDLVRKGHLPKITWIESRPNSFNEKMKLALTYLHSSEAEAMGCMILNGYDYAWIKLAMDSRNMPERYNHYKYMSTPKFVEYIRYLGFTDIAGSKTINKFLTHARWHSGSNRIAFNNIRISPSESERRILISLKFLEIIIEA